MQSPLMGIFRVLQMAQDLLGIDVNSLENQPLMSKKSLKYFANKKYFITLRNEKPLKFY